MRGAETVGRARPAEITDTEAPMFRILPRGVRFAMVLRALQRDMTLPLPTPDLEPTGNVPMPELFTRWEAEQREMRRVLETLQGNERRYWHPVLGPLTAKQMLDLAQVHTAYHIRQIKARQRDSAFPQTHEAKI